MNSYMPETVERALVENSIRWDDLVYTKDGHKAAILMLGEAVLLEKVASNEAEEEQDSAAFVVIKVGTQYFRKDGTFRSHYGTEWNTLLRQVHPTTKTIQVFE